MPSNRLKLSWEEHRQVTGMQREGSSVSLQEGPQGISVQVLMFRPQKFLDRFGYNRVGLNLTGPLFSKKDIGHKNQDPDNGLFFSW